LLVLAGCVPWVAFAWSAGVLPALGVEVPSWAYDLAQPIAFLVYPIAIFVAMFRFHLFDIELVVKRGLVYSLVTICLVVLLYAAINLAGLVVPEVSVRGGIPLWAASAIMMVVGLLFVPLRNAARHLVDRQLFPERLAMRQSLAELAAQLPSLGNLNAIGTHLVRRVTEIFGFSSATLLVADPRSGVLVTLASSVVDVETRFGQSFLLEGSDPGVDLLQRAGRPMTAEQVAPHSAALAQRLAAFDAVLALSLTSGDTLTGILLLGRKVDGERLAAEEQELLTLLAPMVATVLENVRLFESATFESLTGLLRREAILDALEREVQRAARYHRPLTVGMADIDRFKRVNDLFGHLAGDALLKRVAQALKVTLRSSDAIGRYGGEEFLFFLPETDLAGGVRVAEKLRRSVEALRDPVEGAEGVLVTISVGLAELELSDDPQTVDQVIAAADANLLAAKREGRNRVVPPPAAA
jgi:diguanylate cyclase (GGDEF)-like protein